MMSLAWSRSPRRMLTSLSIYRGHSTQGQQGQQHKIHTLSTQYVQGETRLASRMSTLLVTLTTQDVDVAVDQRGPHSAESGHRAQPPSGPMVQPYTVAATLHCTVPHSPLVPIIPRR